MRAESHNSSELLAGASDVASVPLIAHIIHRLDVGGLENGLVNLINHIPSARFRHAVICVTDYSPRFRERIRRREVSVFALNKPPGNSLRMHFKLWRLLKQLRPDIIHTRNLSALEGMLPAAIAGVPVRIHGEHGRDMEDLAGNDLRRQRLRRLFKPFVHHYIALSRELERYLHEQIEVSPGKVAQLYNGVDIGLFRPAQGGREALPLAGFAPPSAFVIGTVGRMQAVKDQLTLARAFVLLLRMMPRAEGRLRLVMIGDGPVRAQVAAILNEAGAAKLAWLAGERHDVPQIMRGLDLFVLPSLAEGISNTLLEAMSTGLPVVATAVGGNVELVDEAHTGMLVPPADPSALARAMCEYAMDPARGTRHGCAARRIVEQRFGLDVMVQSYMGLYDRALAGSRRLHPSRGAGSRNPHSFLPRVGERERKQ